MAKAKTDEKVMTFVEEELKKNPDISVDELQAKAAGVNQEIEDLSARQFNARYPLQVKRRMAAAEGGKRTRTRKKTRATSTASTPRRRGARKKAAPAEARDAVRGAFLRFASELAAAEERKDLVKVLAGVDGYVDEVLKATGD